MVDSLWTEEVLSSSISSLSVGPGGWLPRTAIGGSRSLAARVVKAGAAAP